MNNLISDNAVANITLELITDLKSEVRELEDILDEKK